MNKNGITSKLMYSNTEENITAQIRIHYNPRTNHITFGSASFRKSPGWSNSSVTNKRCSAYLGITVAEQVLASVFKNVQRMPYGNPGFDFKCSNGYLIDVKSSCRHHHFHQADQWTFTIKKNKIAEYFLCLAFDNREDLNPQHVWLIPGKEVNHLVSLSISELRIHKWDKYALDISRVTTCCNIMRGDE